MSALRRFLVPAIVVVVVLSGLAVLLRSLVLNTPDQDARKPQQITLLKPPPPPPPKVDEPPPPPEVQEEVEISEPEAMPEDLPETADAPPPGDALGLDAEGGAGNDGFGLAGRRGGRGLLEGGGSAQAWFEGELTRRLTEVMNRVLRDADAQRAKRATFTVRVRVAPDGRVELAELVDSTGDTTLDRALEQAMTGVRLGRELPDEVRRALRVRVSTAQL